MIEIIIHEDTELLDYCTALQRIQAIQQTYLQQQVEAFGRTRDEMSEAKADLDARGER